MKRLILAALMCVLTLEALPQSTGADYVEVLYFHGRQRCLTCRAIEKYSKETVYADFADMVKKKKVRFREVDISTDEGGELAKKYRVSWSSLYVNRHKGKAETRSDMTAYAFKNARSNTKAFKDALKQKITQLLK